MFDRLEIKVLGKDNKDESSDDNQSEGSDIDINNTFIEDNKIS